MITTNRRRADFSRSDAPNLNRNMNTEQRDSTIEITKHKIFNKTLSILENKRLRVTRTGQILHKKSEAFLTDTLEIVVDAPGALFYDLKQGGKLDLIGEARAVVVPNFILNALLCESLEKQFTRAQILASGAFVLIEGYLRLDVDEYHVRRGFMMPIIDAKSSLIVGLRVFRYPNDERPFVLKARNFNLGVKK